MLQVSTFKFLKDLKKNNNKPWFDANRKSYDAAKEDFIQLVKEIIENISRFDSSISNLQPKECIFRINRDVRFSKDKSPYKTNMGASFSKGGKKINSAGYYFHFEPGQCFLGGGLWMPEAENLNKIRQEIDYNFGDWKKIVNNASFKKTFAKGLDSSETLVRPPKGYEENNPAIEYLKLKSFVAMTPIADSFIENKNFAKEAAKVYKAMHPLIEFLNKAID